MKSYTVLSYPRSGSNLGLRYLWALAPKANYQKTHRVHNGGKRKPNSYVVANGGPLLVFLRNYKECITRHSGIASILERKLDFHIQSLKETFEQDLHVQAGSASSYLSVLETFDRCKFPKLLVYYEDMILNPKNTIQKMGTWLGVGQGVIDTVQNNHEKIKNNALQAYREKSYTKGQNLFYHSERNPDGLNDFADRCAKKAGSLFERYLARYES